MPENKASLFTKEREKMVQEQIIQRGITTPSIINAIKKVPRHIFVPKDLRHLSYSDQALSLGVSGSTISQPYVVALMLDLADIKKGDKVFELGTGSGYTSALLAELGASVYGKEIEPALVELAKENLKKWDPQKAKNIHLEAGDGSKGWPEHQPFDKIIVSAAFSSIPRDLIKQLSPNKGRMIIPLGSPLQECVLIVKEGDKLKESIHGPVAFVPSKKESKS